MPRSLTTNRSQASNRFRIRDMGTCVSINAPSNLINLPANTALQPGSGNFALSLWFKPQLLSGGSHIILQQNPTDYTNGYLLVQGGGSGKDLVLYINSAAPTLTVTNYFADVLYRWHMITVVARGSKVYVFRNADQITNGAASWNFSANVGVTIGSSPQFSSNITGLVDEIIFWKGVIPDDASGDVYNLYLKGYDGLDVSSKTAVSRYKLDEGAGTTVTDSIGSNHGTITGATYSTDVALKPRTKITPTVQNFYTYSEDASQWNQEPGVTATLSNDVPPPSVGGAVSRIVYDGFWIAGEQRIQAPTTASFPVGPYQTVKNRFWARTLSGSIDLLLYTNVAGSLVVPITITDTWQEFSLSLTSTFGGTAGTPAFVIASPAAVNDAFTIYITRLQGNWGNSFLPYYQTTNLSINPASRLRSYILGQ